METSSQAIEDTSLTDDLAAAWAAAEADEVEVEEEEIEEEAPQELVAEEPEPEEQPPEQEDIAAQADESAPPANDLDKAPVGLPPAAREAWKDTPAPVREALAKRERDFANGIKQYAENAKRAELMDRSLAPYQQYFAMQNQPPGQTVSTLLQTASILQMGSPQQKADMVANLINQFGVDIDALDNRLSGAPQQQAPQQQQPAFRPEQIPQLVQQELQRREQAMVGQRVNNDVQAFASDPQNEFYVDVRNDMADILDLSARQGRDMSLKQAYDRACAINPDISRIIAQREAQKQRNGRRSAASSISGAPAAPHTGAEHDSIRDALEAAWDGVGRV